MDNNLNILLKTENGDSVETNDIQEDPFKYSKYKIKNIQYKTNQCNVHFCHPLLD